MTKKRLPVPSEALAQFYKFCALGAFSFFMDAVLLYVLTESGVHYLVSSAISFVIVVVAQFFVSKKFIFTVCRLPLRAELASYFGISLVGLGITEVCMYFFTGVTEVYYLFSKVLTTAIVLAWNFSVRKFWLYR
jgi:putative flippase GtrA